MKVLWAVATAVALVLLSGLAAQPANAATGTVYLQAGSTTCSAQANNPHATYNTSGQRVVLGKTVMGYCSGAATSMTYRLTLEKCVHSSFGCIWSSVATVNNSLTPTSGGQTRLVDKSCESGHYRQRADVTLYANGTSDSDTSYSPLADVAC